MSSQPVMEGLIRELLRHRLIIPLLMRLFLLTLMIVLLPLRGWVGDDLTMQGSVPEHQVAMGASVQDNCHEMQQHDMHQPSVATDTAQAEEDCGNCTSCDTCHSLALAATLLPAPVVQARMRQPPALSRRHASADLHPGFKPPIAGG